ncbi:hypothetical protein ACFYU9_12205 [Streptomyces sp. NPDC004327]|uniref:hypothetical protein n=1 Tax=unclassified Streptomyces TaxID=2593676 RepID=UPI003680C6F7
MPAIPRPLMAALALAAAGTLALGAAPAAVAAKPVTGKGVGNEDLAKARDATEKYRSEQAAVDAGYVRTDMCVEDTGKDKLGGMGFHYVDPANVGSLDPAKPAAVLYAPDKTGKRVLVAIEYIVPDTGQPRPKLFGHDLDGPAVTPGVGNVYTLHAWIFRKNPEGVFTPYNPRVHCTRPDHKP